MFSAVFRCIPSIPCFAAGSCWSLRLSKLMDADSGEDVGRRKKTTINSPHGAKRRRGRNVAYIFQPAPLKPASSIKPACVGVFEVLTDSGDPSGRYPRHVFKFQNLRTFHSGRGAAVLSLRRLPACEWRGKERNVTPATGGGREERGGALFSAVPQGADRGRSRAGSWHV